jgi:hypothetical protein
MILQLQHPGMTIARSLRWIPFFVGRPHRLHFNATETGVGCMDRKQTSRQEGSFADCEKRLNPKLGNGRRSCPRTNRHFPGSSAYWLKILFHGNWAMVTAVSAVAAALVLDISASPGRPTWPVTRANLPTKPDNPRLSPC